MEYNTTHAFLDRFIEKVFESHDPDEDGGSTSAVISVVRRLRDQVNDVPVTGRQKRYIGDAIVNICGEYDEGYDITSQIEALADTINRWG